MLQADSFRTPAFEHAVQQLLSMPLEEDSMPSLLQTVAEVSKRLILVDLETSLTVVDSRHKVTVASTSTFAMDLDEVQYAMDHGPCLHAATTGELTEVTDTRTETRWSDYMECAASKGNLSSLSVPLTIGEGVAAALNLYARQPDAFDSHARSTATAFAPLAANSVANARAYQAAKDRVRNLESAAQVQPVIERAKGILMAQRSISAHEAFTVLTTLSGRRNVKVIRLAEHLVATGELPPDPRRR